MDDFETISLDSKECKICKQETSEELISCVLHDNFSNEGASIQSAFSGETSFAHRLCLERWDTVMRSCYCPTAQKRTWKDRIKGLVSVGSSKANLPETWTPVLGVKREFSKQYASETLWQNSETGHSRFNGTSEAYRVENVASINSEQQRKSKVRIRSIDMEDEEKPCYDHQRDNPRKKSYTQFTREALLKFGVPALKETIEYLISQINEASSELISHLQERDSLFLQAHTMQVSVAQLISLQSNVKTASTQNVTKSITCSRNSQDTLKCT